MACLKVRSAAMRALRSRTANSRAALAAVLRGFTGIAQLCELFARFLGALFGNLLGLLGLGKLSGRCHKCAAHLGEFPACLRGSGFRDLQGGMRGTGKDGVLHPTLACILGELGSLAATALLRQLFANVADLPVGGDAGEAFFGKLVAHLAQRGIVARPIRGLLGQGRLDRGGDLVQDREGKAARHVARRLVHMRVPVTASNRHAARTFQVRRDPR